MLSWSFQKTDALYYRYRLGKQGNELKNVFILDDGGIPNDQQHQLIKLC